MLVFPRIYGYVLCSQTYMALNKTQLECSFEVPTFSVVVAWRVSVCHVSANIGMLCQERAHHATQRRNCSLWLRCRCTGT